MYGQCYWGGNAERKSYPPHPPHVPLFFSLKMDSLFAVLSAGCDFSCVGKKDMLRTPLNVIILVCLHQVEA